MNGACDICGQVNCNAITLTEDPYRKEQIVVNGFVVPEDIIVETSPGAAVKVHAAGTQVTLERAIELGLVTAPKAAAASAAPKPTGARKRAAKAAVETRPKATEKPAKAPAKS